ncbi:MAG: hypothetical protein JOY99_12890 [Sphingomonadaceae bacterium]|nr:hypothetical protein [Sphingomonadaceae bacterium]
MADDEDRDEVSCGDDTPPKTGLRPAWAPGQSGNPAGRPRGARNKLGEAFIADVLADWQQHGPAVIARVRTERPAIYLRVIASILPRELNVRTNELDELTDEQLETRLRAQLRALAAAGGDLFEDGDAAIVVGSETVQ